MLFIFLLFVSGYMFGSVSLSKNYDPNCYLCVNRILIEKIKIDGRLSNNFAEEALKNNTDITSKILYNIASNDILLKEFLPFRMINKNFDLSIKDVLNRIVRCGDISSLDNISFNQCKLREEILFINSYYGLPNCPEKPMFPKSYEFNPLENNFIRDIFLESWPLFKLYSRSPMDFLSKDVENKNDEGQRYIIKSTDSSNYIFFQNNDKEKMKKFNRDNQGIYLENKKNLVYYVGQNDENINAIFPKTVGMNFLNAMRIPDFIIDSFDEYGTYVFGYYDQKKECYTSVSLYVGFFVNEEGQGYSEIGKFRDCFQDDKVGNFKNAWIANLFEKINDTVKNNENKKVILKIHFLGFLINGWPGTLVIFSEAFKNYPHNRFIVSSVFCEKHKDFYVKEWERIRHFFDKAQKEDSNVSNFEPWYLLEHLQDVPDFFDYYSHGFVVRPNKRLNTGYKQYIASLGALNELNSEEYCIYLIKFLLNHVLVARRPYCSSAMKARMDSMVKINAQDDFNELLLIVQNAFSRGTSLHVEGAKADLKLFFSGIIGKIRQNYRSDDIETLEILVQRFLRSDDNRGSDLMKIFTSLLRLLENKNVVEDAILRDVSISKFEILKKRYLNKKNCFYATIGFVSGVFLLYSLYYYKTTGKFFLNNPRDWSFFKKFSVIDQSI